MSVYWTVLVHAELGNDYCVGLFMDGKEAEIEAKKYKKTSIIQVVITSGENEMKEVAK